MGERRISSEVVRHVAELARLSLPAAEVEAVRAQLESVLDYMGELDQVDVTGVEPTLHPVHPGPGDGAMREDVPRPSLSRQDALAAAPRVGEASFAVPRVVEVDG